MDQMSDVMYKSVSEGELPISKRKVLKEALRLNIDQACRILGMIQHFRLMEEPFQLANKNPKTSLQDSLYQVFRAMQYEFPKQKMMVIKRLSSKINYIPVERNYFEAILFQLIQHAHRSIDPIEGMIEIEADEKWYLSDKHETYSSFALSIGYVAKDNNPCSQENIFEPWKENGEVIEKDINMGLFAVKQWVKHLGGVIQFRPVKDGMHRFEVEFKLY